MVANRYYLLIVDEGDTQVLLQHEPEGWCLPQFDLDEAHVWQDVSHVNRMARQRLGLSVSTLRCLLVGREPRSRRLTKLYALESRDSSWRPPADLRWFKTIALADLQWSRPAQPGWVQDWLSAEARTPWYRPGWWKRAAGWLQQRMIQFGVRPAPPIEQLRSWERSAILRAGRAYFKAVPPMFAHELALTQALARHYPDHFAPVLALDQANGWFLMADVGDRALTQERSVTSWEEALATFARLQAELAEHAEWLLNLGCPERRLETMAAQLGPLLADTPAMLPGQPGGLTRPEIERLCAMQSQLERSCRELARYAIPASLEHGDFWAGQVLLFRDRPVFIDWSDSSLAHPFFSLATFLMDIENELPAVPDARERLRDAYLAQWAGYGSPADLSAAYELARPLAMLHLTLTYHRTILPNLDARWEMETMLPWYLKKLLDLLPG